MKTCLVRINCLNQQIADQYANDPTRDIETEIENSWNGAGSSARNLARSSDLVQVTLLDNGGVQQKVQYRADGSEVHTYYNKEGTQSSGGSVYDGKAMFGTNFIGPGPDANPYKLPDPKRPGKFLQPLDAVDAAAQRHDNAYWKIGASGIKGALFDKKVRNADLVLATEAFIIMQGYMGGHTDNITGLPISFRTVQVYQL